MSLRFDGGLSPDAGSQLPGTLASPRAGLSPAGRAQLRWAQREDALTLFGFATAEGRDCFESLLGAHGVGPGLALAILSVHGPAELRRAVFEGDLDALTLVPGVGHKTAARLLLELKSRFEVPDDAGFDGDGPASGAGSSSRAEVRSALAALGYQPEEVRRAVGDLPADGDVGSQLRRALQTLGASR